MAAAPLERVGRHAAADAEIDAAVIQVAGRFRGGCIQLRFVRVILHGKAGRFRAAAGAVDRDGVLARRQVIDILGCLSARRPLIGVVAVRADADINTAVAAVAGGIIHNISIDIDRRVVVVHRDFQFGGTAVCAGDRHGVGAGGDIGDIFRCLTAYPIGMCKAPRPR